MALSPLFRPVFWSILSCWILPGTSALWAQPPGASAANAITDFKGELVGMQQGTLIVKRDDGTEVKVLPPDETPAFQFVAKALPAFLARGQMVRFSGTFDQAGNAKGNITKVTLFKPLGRGAKLRHQQRQSYVPGIYPQTKHGNERVPAVAKVNVVGSALGLSPQGYLMVQAGKQPLQVPLAPDVQFEIRLHDLSMAREGDQVRVRGFYEPPNDTMVKGDRITVTTDRVYGEKSPAAKKSAQTKAGKKSKKDVPGSSTKKN